MTNPHYVFFEDQMTGTRRLYENPHEVITVYAVGDIKPALAKLQQYQKHGFYLAGYFAYELGYVLEPVLRKFLPRDHAKPLLQFGVFKGFGRQDIPAQGTASLSGLAPLWSKAQYQRGFAKIMAYIRAGDVYQINLSFPVTGNYHGSAGALYRKLKPRQPVRYGGVINLGGACHISLSPELFFEIKNDKIFMRPMKGTMRRGVTDDEDKALARGLQKDDKNRAENLMIVDLLRNDISRISRAGSVKVTDLFSVETFPTLHTMTSGIEAHLQPRTDLHNILRALFPCGSITGAPKIRAQEIISALENRNRGAYCGALGFIDPDDHMRFNVGIRTLTLSPDGQFSYPVGSGIVADSKGSDEYAECLLKAKFLQDDYGLIETLAWDEPLGFFHFELHMQRLATSAQTLGFVLDMQAVQAALTAYCQPLTGPQKIRLELAKNGSFDISHQNLKLGSQNTVWNVCFSKHSIDSRNPLCVHKTTQRDFFEEEVSRLKAQTDCQEVLFFNEKDELCEGSFTNVFIVKDGQMFTPPVASGLLPGILRRVLLANGEVVEKKLNYADVLAADEIYIGNSVRGLMCARLVSEHKI